MQMALQPMLILIPAIVGLFWLITCSVVKPGNDYYRKFKRFIAVLSFFFLFVALSSDLEFNMMLHFVLFKQVCALAIIPSFISLIKEYGYGKATGLLFKLCCMIPMIHLVVGMECVYVAGFEDSVRIYTESLSFSGPMFPFLDDNGDIVVYACYTYMFKGFVLLDFVLFAVNMMTYMVNKGFRVGDTVGYLFKGGSAKLVHVIYSLTLVMFLILIPGLMLGRSCYYGSIVVTAAASLLLAYLLMVISITGIAGPVEAHSQRGIINSLKKKVA